MFRKDSTMYILISSAKSFCCGSFDLRGYLSFMSSIRIKDTTPELAILVFSARKIWEIILFSGLFDLEDPLSDDCVVWSCNDLAH